MVKNPIMADKKTIKKLKDKNMNIKLPHDDYSDLQNIADSIGGMSLSSMIRTLVYAQLNKVRRSGNPADFLDVIKKK